MTQPSVTLPSPRLSLHCWVMARKVSTLRSDSCPVFWNTSLFLFMTIFQSPQWWLAMFPRDSLLDNLKTCWTYTVTVKTRFKTCENSMTVSWMYWGCGAGKFQNTDGLRNRRLARLSHKYKSVIDWEQRSGHKSTVYIKVYTLWLSLLLAMAG